MGPIYCSFYGRSGSSEGAAADRGRRCLEEAEVKEQIAENNQLTASHAVIAAVTLEPRFEALF